MLKRRLCAMVFSACMGAASPKAAAAVEELVIPVVYLELPFDRPPVLSNLVEHPADEGEQGARLGLEDNNTTGRFLKQVFKLETYEAETADRAMDAARNALSGGPKLVILNAPDAAVNAIADLPEAGDDLIFNTAATAVSLRDNDCRPNVLHTAVSRDMLSDALMQFLAKRRWANLMLIEGNREGDKAYAQALRNSARKFGLKFETEKTWLTDADIRRNAAQEVPVFTQEGDYDAVLIADEDDDFGPYVMYNTWLPRPVAGTAGLEPAGWTPAMEQWGAVQLQARFREQAGRSMTAVDYAAWAAMRAIGEGVTQTKFSDPATIRAFLLSDAFSLAGFKGVKLSFRPWNGQLRQPVPIAHPQAVVATAPIEGFLHQRNELDTLGIDAPETQCGGM